MLAKIKDTETPHTLMLLLIDCFDFPQQKLYTDVDRWGHDPGTSLMKKECLYKEYEMGIRLGLKQEMALVIQ